MATAAAEPAPPRAHRFLHFYLPDLEVLRDPNAQVLMVSRALSLAGMSALTYGAMVYAASAGGTQLDVSILSVSGSVAGLAFGLRGGIIADSASKRVALGLSYAVQALLCIVAAIAFDGRIAALLLLIFAVSLLGQITSPAQKAAAAVVATASDVGTVTVVMGFVASLGAAAGSALIAPTVMKVWGIRVVLGVAGGLLGMASVRAFTFPSEPRRAKPARATRGPTPKAPGLRDMRQWIFSHQAVATMILVGASVGALSDIFGSLQPVYVRSVLGGNPANTVYIFAPGAVGTGLGTALTPALIRKAGERWLAAVSLGASCLAMTLFALIDQVAPVIGPWNPLRLMERFGGVELDDALLAAGLIAILVQFGTTCAGAAGQAYINRRVPIAGQGATFGIQTELSTAVSIAGTLATGALANLVGVRLVLLVTPALVLTAVVQLLVSSYAIGGEPAPSRRDVLASFWENPADKPALN